MSWGLLSFKRQGWLTLSEPQLLLPQNRDENASPTGSLRTVSDTQEQAHGPVLVAGLSMPVGIQATSYSFSPLLLGARQGKEKKKALWEVHYNVAAML